MAWGRANVLQCVAIHTTSSSIHVHEVASFSVHLYLLPSSGKKKKDGGGGFESAMEAAEQDVKKVEAMKKYPGLCLPDNPEQAMKLLQPDGRDVRAAKDALSEVGETDRGIYCNMYMYPHMYMMLYPHMYMYAMDGGLHQTCLLKQPKANPWN